MLQQDSVGQEQASLPEMPADGAGHGTAGTRHHSQEPHALPAGDTSVRQDSAVLPAARTGDIRYSARPDTLHLPGHDAGRSVSGVSLPEYYRESFFAADTLLHPEADGGRYGVAGDPVPYTVRADNIITLMLLASFVLAMAAFAKSQRFILRQAKSFFYVPHRDTPAVTETSGEVRFQFFLVLQACLLFSILQFFYTQHYIGNTFILKSQYQLIAIYFGMYAGYFAVKGLVYTIVNAVFFGARKSIAWLKVLLFITSVEGVLIFPVVLLQVYFDMPMQSVIYYVLFVLLAVKILTFYKCYIIFFRRTNGFLQIILYLCALEMTPLAAFWGTLVITGNYLKINF